MFPLKWNLLLVIVICDPQIYGIGKLRIPRQIVDITCSACDRRLAAEPPQVCCRCIDQSATCNNDIATQAGPGKELPTGIACKSSIECESSGDCDPAKESCKVQNTNVIDSIRQRQKQRCPSGKKVCCNPGPGGGFEARLGIVSANNPLGELTVDTQDICNDPKLSAVQDFGKGITCGKRDSRYPKPVT